MSETKSIALASTLALGPPRSWVDGCAAWVDSRDEQRYHALVGERDEKVKVNRLDY